MSAIRTLEALAPGESAWVWENGATGAMKARLMDLGFLKGSRVTCLFASALGDPRAYALHGTVIALRDADARSVRVAAEEGAG